MRGALNSGATGHDFMDNSSVYHVFVSYFIVRSIKFGDAIW